MNKTQNASCYNLFKHTESRPLSRKAFSSVKAK